MGLAEKLRQARDFVRKRRGPDSYFQYKRKREGEREDAEEGRERARGYARQDRAEAERDRKYEERYTDEPHP
jgi:hypothetical protein